jgi:uncharacterized protein YlxW (UPF0749 family)
MAVTTAGTSVTTDTVAPEPRPRGSSWLFQVTALSLVLGCMLGLALQAQRALKESGLPGNRLSILVPYYNQLKESNHNLQQEIGELRQKNMEFQVQLAKGSDATKTLSVELATLQKLAGLTPVHGPGLEITLRDTPLTIPANLNIDPEAGLIHDRDLALFINELKAAGAEALAVAGADGRPQRIILSSAPRCAGPITRVNDAPLAEPYKVWAIGDPASLESALMMKGGIVDMLQLKVLEMIEIRRSADIKLPGYSGSIRFAYAKPLSPDELPDAE